MSCGQGGVPNHGLSRCWGALLYDSSIPGSWAYLFSVGTDPKCTERGGPRGEPFGVGGTKGQEGWGMTLRGPEDEE